MRSRLSKTCVAALATVLAGTALAQAPDGGATPAIDPVAPTPPVLLTPSPALYPPAAIAARLGGRVQLELLIDIHGEVEQAQLIQGADPMLNRAALEAAAGLVFEPAKQGDQPIAAYLTYIYEFDPPPPPSARLAGELRIRGHNARAAGAELSAQLVGAVASSAALTATADDQGRFDLALPPGTWQIRAAFPGMLKLDRIEQLKEGQRLEVIYYLHPTGSVYEATVFGDRERREVSRVDISGQEARAVPGTLGGDPFRAVLSLPGVDTMLSGISLPIVRGAAPASTGWYLDGIRVPNLFHFFLLSSVIHPKFIESMEFYPSAYPAQYGRFTGGIVAAQTATGERERIRGDISIDIINTGLFLETPFDIAGHPFTTAVGGRVAYPSVLFSLLARKEYVQYWDYQGRVETKLGPGKLRLLGFGSQDELGQTENKIRERFYSVRFHRADLRWQGRAGGTEIDTGFTYGHDILGIGDAFDITTQSFMPRVALSWALHEKFTLRAGADGEHKEMRQRDLTNQRPSDGPPVGPGNAFNGSGFVGGVFVEGIWKLGRFTLVPALRGEAYLGMDAEHFVPEPRFAVRLRANDLTTWKLGTGLYHQVPTAYIQLPIDEPPGKKLQEAVHLALGVERRLPWFGLDLDITAFGAERLAVYELMLMDPDVEELMRQGRCGTAASPFELQNSPCNLDPLRKRRGRTVGLELMLRRKMGDRFFGWISYTLSRTWNWTPGHTWFPSMFDRTHILNAVVSYDFKSNFTLGVGMRLTTGTPHTSEHLEQVTGATRPQGPNIANCDHDLGGALSQCWVRDSPLGSRLPPFFRVDLRLEKRWIKDRYTLALYLDVLNALVREEVVGRSYSFDDNRKPQIVDDGIPLIVPMLGVRGSF